jgi:hypothetical protein
MATELKIRVVFDTGGTKPPTEQVKVLEGSLKDLEMQYKKLQAIAEKSFVAGSPEQINAMNNAQQALARYKSALGEVGNVMPGVTKGSANAAMTLQALNYTVRDSPYFFRDFSLGILAIGNNLNPLIDGMTRMKQETGSLTKGLMASLSGTNGAIFAFSVLVSMLQAVTFAMAKTGKETANTKDEMKKLADEIERMSRGTLKGTIAVAETRLDEMRRRLEDTANRVTMGSGAVRVIYDPAQQEAIKGEEEYIQKLKTRLATLGDIVAINNRIAELRERQNNLIDNPQLSKALGEQIAALEKDRDALAGKVDLKEKAWITTDATLKLEIAILETLKEQAKSVRERLAYEDQIRERRMELGAFSGMPMDELPFSLPGQKPLVGGKEITDNKAKQKIREMKNPLEDAVRLTKEENKQLSEMESLSTQVGNSLFQAFTQGGFAADKFLASLVAIAAQLVIIEGLKYFLTGGVSGIFGIGGSLGSTMTAPKLPGLQGGSFLKSVVGDTNMPNIGTQKSLQAINMNMQSGQPTILIKTDIDGLKFTKKVINPAQAKLIRGNVVSVS